MNTTTWFKMFLSFAPVINAIPSENVGEGVKAAMRYFKNGELPTAGLSDMSDAVFEMLKDSIDQAFTDTSKKSEQARNAVNARWEKRNADNCNRIQPNTDVYDRIRMDTEEKRREEKREEEKRRDKNTTTPQPPATNGAPAEPTGDNAGGGGGDLIPEILEYAREKAKGARNPAAYEAAILDRIRKAGYKTIEEVIAADEDRRKKPEQQPVYAEEDDFY